MTVKEKGFFYAENVLLSVFGLQDVATVKVGGTTQKKVVQRYERRRVPSFTKAFFTFFLTLFVLFSVYQIVYGIYNNVLYSMWRLEYINEEPEHSFKYFIVDTVTLDFTTQPHFILLTHSIFGGVFLILSFAQTAFTSITLTNPKYTKYHRTLGKICLVSSLISSFSACILSYRALHGTELTYLLGTSMWFFFTLMTFIRVKQRDYLAHSRWAVALQQVGIMFTTTRIIAPLCLWYGISKEDSYHLGVLGAGLLAHFLFFSIESYRHSQLSSHYIKEIGSEKKAAVQMQPRSVNYLHRVYMWSLGGMAFFVTPLLRFSTVFEGTGIDKDSVYLVEAVMLTTLILISVFRSN